MCMYPRCTDKLPLGVKQEDGHTIRHKCSLTWSQLQGQLLRLYLDGDIKGLISLDVDRPLGVFKPCPTTDDVTICGNIHTPSSIIGLREGREEGEGEWTEEGGGEGRKEGEGEGRETV